MREIGYGVVGVGYFGAGLAERLAEQPGAVIRAVFDPENGGAMAKKLGCDASPTLEALCRRSDIDAVVVATPNDLHKEPVILAAQNKKHIFCEKPIALSYRDCDEMVKAAQENGVLFMAGHIMNFMSGVRRAKEVINAGEIGELLFCHACRSGWEDESKTVSWKKIRSMSGGHLYHHIHELDCIQFIMGPAVAAYMRGGNFAHRGERFGDQDDMLFITLEFANRTCATLQYGSAFHMGDHFVKIQGTKGAILIDLQDVKVLIKTPDGTTRHLLHESKQEDDDRTRSNHTASIDGAIAYGAPGTTPPQWLCTIMRREMEFFHGLMQGNEAAPEFSALLDGTAARAAIATADACTISCRENRRVCIREVV